VPLRVELRSESGEAVRDLSDPAGGSFDAAGDFDRLLPQFGGRPRPPSVGYKLFQYVDPYGNTVFNRPQMADLLDDIGRASRLEMTSRERRGLERLRVMAEGARDSVHLYLWFIGD
jgi:hypothetical protein